MTQFKIFDILIDFPFEPYECQRQFMTQLLQALRTKTDAALESPTGTGKTLSLLCSVLAWVQKEKLKAPDFQSMMQMANKEKTEEINIGSTIYYCSRTHSQLEQVVRELNRTKYHSVRSAIIGSRDQFCINPKVKQIKETTAQTHACRGMVSKRTCHFYNRFDSMGSDKLKEIYETGQALDIETLVGLGKQNGCCPYFVSRQRKEKAELVLLPYNYIIDPKMRRRYKLDLRDSIVIFDEAHNLESICEANSSAELTSTQLAMAIAELQKTLTLRVDEEETARTEADNSTAAFGAEKIERATNQINTSQVAKTLNMLFSLEEAFEKMWACSQLQRVENLDGKAANGECLITHLEEIGLDANAAVDLTETMSKVVEYLLEKGEEFPIVEKGDGVERVRDFLLSIFTTHAQEVAAAVGSETIRLADRINPKTIAQHCKLYMKRDSEKLTVKYFCFQASVSMRMLKMRGVRNVILTSGTLSPMPNFVEIMGLNFGAVLESQHAVKEVPVMTSVITKGVRAGISGSFGNRTSEEYLTEIGECLVRIVEAVPQGVLTFFSSYSQMNSFINAWKRIKRWNSSLSLWDRMNQIKDVVVEPKQKEEVALVRITYARGVQSTHGAMMLAVCRGKMSEGIDFCDAESRAVVVVGLPYPPINDERVVLKKLFLEDMLAKNKKGMHSRDWYQIEALRAVNQAIGRVLRHKDDFGVVVLLDSRFSGISPTMFPKWLRLTINKADIVSTIPRISKFFDDRSSLINVSKRTYSCMSTNHQVVSKTSAVKRSAPSEVPTLSELFQGADIDEIAAGNLLLKPAAAQNSVFSLPTNEEEMERRVTDEKRPLVFRPLSAYAQQQQQNQAGTSRGPPRKKILIVPPKRLEPAAIPSSPSPSTTPIIPDKPAGSSRDDINRAMKIPSSEILAWLSDQKKACFASVLRGYRGGKLSITEMISQIKPVFLPSRPDLLTSCANLITIEEDRNEFIEHLLTLNLRLFPA